MTFPGKINLEAKPGVVVVDNFLSNPDEVRGLLLLNNTRMGLTSTRAGEHIGSSYQTNSSVSFKIY